MNERDSLEAFRRLERGTMLRNQHGALYRVHEVMTDEGGCSAVVVDGDKTGGEGKVVWIDARDVGPGALEVLDA